MSEIKIEPHWIRTETNHVEPSAVCSECGFDWIWSDIQYFSFCPNCGKKVVQRMSDSVEVIRCKDCKNYKTKANLAFGYPTKVCSILDYEDMDEDDFCSRAERKKEVP